MSSRSWRKASPTFRSWGETSPRRPRSAYGVTMAAKRKRGDPEKIRAYSARYWAANREKLRAKNAARYKVHAGENRAYAAAWRAANREKHLANLAAWRASNPEKHRSDFAIWYAANRERSISKAAAWARSNLGKRCDTQKKRHAAKLHSIPVWLTPAHYAEISDWYRRANAEGLSVDHIVPLQGKNVCGLHVPWNMQLLTRAQNSKKGNRLP